MKTYYSLNFDTFPACVAALGSFDGVHEGHRAVIGRAKELAAERNLPLTVFTFDGSPKNFFSPGSAPRITDREEKERLLALLGVDNLVAVPFGAEISGLEPRDFFREIVLGKISARAVACGFNYTFGRGGRGDAALLAELCRESGTGILVHPPVKIGGEPVSSSAIRKALAEGDTERARAMLGRPYSINAVVTDGKRLARRLGFPTINQVPAHGTVLPKNGVYLTRTEVCGLFRCGITNIGKRPTVDGEAIISETHIFDFEGDLYGKKVRVEFYDFIRPEEKFASVEEMSKQIYRDIVAARTLAKSKGLC